MVAELRKLKKARLVDVADLSEGLLVKVVGRVRATEQRLEGRGARALRRGALALVWLTVGLPLLTHCSRASEGAALGGPWSLVRDCGIPQCTWDGSDGVEYAAGCDP